MSQFPVSAKQVAVHRCQTGCNSAAPGMSERAISSDLQLNVSPSEELSAGSKSRCYQLDRTGELDEVKMGRAATL